MPETLHLTPIQQRMMRLLEDGQPHHRSELLKCLNDELSKYDLLHFHVSNLRQVLEAHGKDLVCRKQMYRLVSF